MADKNVTSKDNEIDEVTQEVLPLITKARTQRFELLLHLIPNLKQHIILLGTSGIGKTLLLDMLYEIESDVWQCCFVQGSSELSFETIEAQLAKTMMRNNHASLESALHDFKEQNKKIVLIIDDAGALVSGLITTLVEYAASQTVIKLIFSLTPETRNNHRKTDKELEACYILELPALSKRQTAAFLKQLASKPRTYGALQLDDKLLEKIYRDTRGIPARILADFTKLARQNQTDNTKWIASGLAALVFLALAINQGVRHFKEKNNNEVVSTAVLPIPQIAPSEKIATSPPAKPVVLPPVESTIKTDADIVPEFKLDIEKKIATTTTPAVVTPMPESEQSAPEKNSTTSEKPVESQKIESANTQPSMIAVEPKSEETKLDVTSTTPKVVEPATPIIPTLVAFPSVEPANGMKIQPLAEKTEIQAVPLVAAVQPKQVKEIASAEPVKKVEPEIIKETPKIVESKKIEHEKVKETAKTSDVKKSESSHAESVKKDKDKETKHESAKEKIEKKVEKPAEIEQKSAKEKTTKVAEKEKEQEKSEPVAEKPAIGRYSLQLITLSSEAAIDNLKKKHHSLNNAFHVVKTGTEQQPRFALMYGGFSNEQDAISARKKLPAEFADAVPRKLTH